ncbi:glycosyltransferase family protein [Scytonema millei]|uniref:Glycosyltransferase n=1 Tax=Scytonema millei VB511283 TaxID=1245923 RepID=A0A9X5I354_9CYAN|nr:glycosyltransferase [Scytonema millei]NHC33167.1 glycosyltransferase [Scytonema millei VB511283]
MRLLVYSHDAFGLGNIRRMLAICEHLLSEIPDLSILLLSGSPMLQGFRLPKGLDYIKLPCLNRGETGEIAVKYLGMDVEETVKLRSELILSAAIIFQPDIFLVDKKPYGLKNELRGTLNYLKKTLPETKLVLLLRDILDCPEKTIAEWQKNDFYTAIDKFYHQIQIVGTPEVFDTVREYRFPSTIAEKVRYCGYLHRQPGQKSRTSIRRELQVSQRERLILVTPGGGEDGYELVDTYLSALAILPAKYRIKSLIICGPEMPETQKQLVERAAENNSQVRVGEFTDDLMSYMNAADVVVSMAGYNTVCEILSAKKPSVIIPRSKPSQEQLIRAEKMANLGLIKTLIPSQENCSSTTLMNLLLSQLKGRQKPDFNLDMNGLVRVQNYLLQLMSQKVCKQQLNQIYQKYTSLPALALDRSAV